MYEGVASMKVSSDELTGPAAANRARYLRDEGEPTTMMFQGKGRGGSKRYLVGGQGRGRGQLRGQSCIHGEEIKTQRWMSLGLHPPHLHPLWVWPPTHSPTMGIAPHTFTHHGHDTFTHFLKPRASIRFWSKKCASFTSLEPIF